ncbi:methylisocitrate lyase [Vulcanisaeta thermophila]|uniref:methylisocitrate lyase n=1 Tax=Vulcanisaeta thermophila TaxID=867917 RepID=UPI000853A250|nr:methylisocitrate lyase [Vulcanisaeta thermophila]
MQSVLLRRDKRDPREVRAWFRERLSKPGIVIAPGAFDAFVALMIQQLGFEAVYVSGAAFSSSLGLPDLGVFTLEELARFTKYITDAVDIPVIVDTDTGFGETLNVVRTVREFESIGAAAIHIEDQELPKKCGHLSGKHVIPADEMVKKIRAAVEARRDENFLIIARTDARGVYGLEEAIWRAQAYVEAGADVIFPEALESKEEFERFAREVKAPLLANMTEFGKSPYLTAKEFEEMGYKIVIFPVTTFRVAMKAVRDALIELKEKGTQRDLLSRMLSRQEQYEVIHYWEYEEWDKELNERVTREFSTKLKLKQ